jgi:hypothetical protein
MSFLSDLLTQRNRCSRITYVPPVNVVYTTPTRYVTEKCDCCGNCSIEPVYKVSESCVQYGVFEGSATSLAVGGQVPLSLTNGNGCDVCPNGTNVNLSAGHTYNVNYSTVVEVAAEGVVTFNILANGTVVGTITESLPATTPTSLSWSGLITTNDSSCSNWCSCCSATSLQVVNASETAVTVNSATLSAYKLA